MLSPVQARRLSVQPASGRRPEAVAARSGGTPANVDTDKDGVIDRYDASPSDARDRRWNKQAAQDYATFVNTRANQLKQEGAEIDCADLAMKLLKDFCESVGMKDPLAGKGKWHTYTATAPGGLPNVKGTNYFHSGFGADALAKQATKDVADLDGDGTIGWDRKTGQVDVGDLRPGDILFYDWEGDGKVNHTVNVLDVAANGTVTLAYGTYDNLGDGPVTWGNLDLLPIQKLVLKPNTPEYDRWLGAGNALWGVRRFTMMTDSASAPVAPAPTPKPTPTPTPAPTPKPADPAPKRLWIMSVFDRLFGRRKQPSSNPALEQWKEVQLQKASKIA